MNTKILFKYYSLYIYLHCLLWKWGILSGPSLPCPFYYTHFECNLSYPQTKFSSLSHLLPVVDYTSESPFVSMHYIKLFHYNLSQSNWIYNGIHKNVVHLVFCRLKVLVKMNFCCFSFFPFSFIYLYHKIIWKVMQRRKRRQPTVIFF